MNEIQTEETGVILPDSGVITLEWAKEQLKRVDAFSNSLLAYGKGSVLFMLKTHLPHQAYESGVVELGTSVETAETYINYLQKKPVIEAIRKKYYVALSVNAAQVIPDNTEDALAICDVVVAKYGRITKDNIVKALEDTGQAVKRMSDAAISVEKMKKKAFHDWLLSEYNMSEDDIYEASKLKPEGLKEFSEKMSQAYFLLGDFKEVYNIIAIPIHTSENLKAQRFLSDLHDASSSITEYLNSEKAYNNLNLLKEKFESEVYPKIQFESEKGK